MLTLETRDVIALGLGFMALLGVFGRLLLSQIDRRLEARFDAQDKARASAKADWDNKFAELAEQNRRESMGWQQLERDFLGWKAELPIQYVRREDYVRNQTVIEAKLDGLALRIENQYLKGNPHV